MDKNSTEKEEEEKFHFPTCNHSFDPEFLCEYLESFSSAKICCPSEGCDQIIPDHIVRECLSNPNLEKYDILCLPPNKVKCLIKDCTFYVAADMKDGHFICEYCKQPNCVTCSNLHLSTEPCGPSKNKGKYESNASKNLIAKCRQNLLQISRSSSVILNPDKSSCPMCVNFLLPRKGIMLTACMHNFCRPCLKDHLMNKDNVKFLDCPSCPNYFSGSECRELLGSEELHELNLKAVKHIFYNCAYPDCTGMWDPGEFKGFHTCKKCTKINCMSCKGIHEGQTCSEYKEKMKSILLKEKEILKTFKSVLCFNCKKIIYIAPGGCGALHCDICRVQVCQFTGLEVGPKGCKCTPKDPCHKDCKFGCIPDN